MMASLFRRAARLLSRRQQKSAQRPLARRRKAFFEGLEDRSLMATLYWDGSASGSWNDVANWSTAIGGGTDPGAFPGAGDDVIFNATTVGSPISSLGANQAANSITFAANSTTPISIAAGNTLTVGSGGITISAGAAAHTINSTVSLFNSATVTNNSASLFTVGGDISSATTGTQTLTVASTGNVTFGGIISDGTATALALSKSGAGTLTFNRTAGANTYSGGTTVDGGVLSLGTGGLAVTSHVGALGTGMVTVNAGGRVRLWIQNNVAFTLANNFTMNGGTLHDEDGNYNMTGTFSVPVTSTFSARYTGKDLTISGPISGAGGVTINNVVANNGGAVILSNAGNSYAGVTTISASTLQIPTTANGGVNSTLGASSSAAANLVLNGGVLRYAGTAAGSTDRLFTLNTTGGTIQSTSGTAANTISFTNTGAIAYGGAGARTLTLGGANIGNNTFSPLLADNGGATSLQKSDAGKWRLENGGNSYTGVTNVATGTLEVTANGALGTVAGNTVVASGATLQFDGTFNYSTAEPIRISGSGVGGVGAINKTNGNGVLSTPILLAGNATIGSATLGSTLTINPDIITASTLTFTGAGNTVMAGSLTAPATNSIANLNSLSTGDYAFTAANQSFNARVDNVGGTGWLLVGRGRQGWEFDTDGQGLVTNVNQNLGTPAAFAPALYSDAIINDLLLQSGFNPTNAEVRIRRAANALGTAFQEARWRSFTNTSWTSVFSNPGVDTNSGGLPVTLEIQASALSGAQTYTGVQTRDAGDNDGRRVFTWGWSGHAGQRGFSYGSAVNLVSGSSPTNFLWENGGENHEIPYTEVYVRSLVPATPGNITKTGTGTLTLQGASNSYTGTTTVNAGVLVAGHSSALGTTAGGTNVFSGGTLALPGGVTINGEALTISGSGAAGQPGALVNIAGSNQLTSNIIAVEATIGSTAGTLTLSGTVNTAVSNLAFGGAGDVLVNSTISSTALPLSGVTGELEIWLDAADINGDNIANNPVDGALVTTWVDKSGKGRNFDSALGDPNLVTSSTHGQPAINFDGDDALRTNLTTNNPRNFIDGNGEFTLISVARYSGADRERVISAVSGHNWLFGFHGT